MERDAFIQVEEQPCPAEEERCSSMPFNGLSDLAPPIWKLSQRDSLLSFALCTREMDRRVVNVTRVTQLAPLAWHCARAALTYACPAEQRADVAGAEASSRLPKAARAGGRPTSLVHVRAHAARAHADASSSRATDPFHKCAPRDMGQVRDRLSDQRDTRPAGTARNET
ncbi:hypothetical protein MTO96_010371 [Rhipicephalus appendiculatus]